MSAHEALRVAHESDTRAGRRGLRRRVAREAAFVERHGCTRGELQARARERKDAAYAKSLATAERDIRARVDVLTTPLRVRRMREAGCPLLLQAWREVACARARSNVCPLAEWGPMRVM